MTETHPQCDCKVGRITSEYPVSWEENQLVTEWQKGTSIRQLTEALNRGIIEAELTAANLGNIEWSQTPVYKALATDELSDADEIEIQRELNRAGVGVDKLSGDLVSHQTVYRHLKQCLGASKTGNDVTPEDRRERARDTVYALQQRTELVAESSLESLQSADVAELGEIDVLVALQVVCENCDRSMDFEHAITEGCDCPPS